MRNLLQYPLTKDETVAWLERKRTEYVNGSDVGGLDGIIIGTLLAIVKPMDSKEFVECFRYKGPGSEG